MALHKEESRGWDPGLPSLTTTASTSSHCTSAREGHDATICRLSRRRDRTDSVRFTLPDVGDGGAATPEYVKRARARRWAS